MVVPLLEADGFACTDDAAIEEPGLRSPSTLARNYEHSLAELDSLQRVQATPSSELEYKQEYCWYQELQINSLENEMSYAKMVYEAELAACNRELDEQQVAVVSTVTQQAPRSRRSRMLKQYQTEIFECESVLPELRDELEEARQDLPQLELEHMEVEEQVSELEEAQAGATRELECDCARVQLQTDELRSELAGEIAAGAEEAARLREALAEAEALRSERSEVQRALRRGFEEELGRLEFQEHEQIEAKRQAREEMALQDLQRLRNRELAGLLQRVASHRRAAAPPRPRGVVSAPPPVLERAADACAPQLPLQRGSERCEASSRLRGCPVPGDVLDVSAGGLGATFSRESESLRDFDSRCSTRLFGPLPI